MIAKIAQPPAVRVEPVDASAATALSAAGVSKGAHGLEGLLNANDFWAQQPYGTRLYYGDGLTDYLHRDVLRAAVELLKVASD